MLTATMKTQTIGGQTTPAISSHEPRRLQAHLGEAEEVSRDYEVDGKHYQVPQGSDRDKEEKTDNVAGQTEDAGREEQQTIERWMAEEVQTAHPSKCTKEMW